MEEQLEMLEKSELIEEITKLRIENRKLTRQFNLANDNMRKYKSATSAKENLSAVITAEKNKQEKQLQAIMEHIPDIIILLDSSMNILLSTKSFLDLTGASGHIFYRYKSFTQVFSAFADNDWLANMEGIFKKVLETNTVHSFDEQLRIDSLGKTRTYAVSVIPFAYGDERNDGILVSFHNMTERYEMEEKLQEALRDATAASRAKSDFLANMSHEIRTPMNAIVGMTSIGKSVADAERKDYSFDKIEDASRHLLGIINDILDMSKIEAGKFELAPEEFKFEKMLQRVVNVINFRVDENNQKFTVTIDKAIPQFLYGDDQRLAQVITNLLGNAVKFTPKNGAISLNTHYAGEENGVCTIQITVTDTGIGISSEHQAKLFQSFQQAENSTSRKFGGTGLGLVISKNIVEMMGGKIDVESEVGKGSTFTFTVQMKRVEKKRVNYSMQSVDWNKMRILAIDDETYVLEEFINIANGLGVLCEVAENAEDALRLVEQNGDYNIYFIDLKMPDIDGIELTKKLRKRAHIQGNPVIIIISSTEISMIAAEAKEAGVDKFLQKPLFPSTIADIISEYLGIAAQQPEEAGADINGIFDGHCILLVEDVEINREIVLALLEPTNITIDCAVNGVEAVQMFLEAPDKYEMIFMDLQMPEMDGYEATRLIRTLDMMRSKTIPIVAMTANVFQEDIEKCLEAGMHCHIGKPINFDEVVGQLRLYLH